MLSALRRVMPFGRRLVLAATIVVAALCLAACSSPAASTGNVVSYPAYSTGTHHAKVVTDKYGSFTITLDADAAPATVQNFCDLAKAGFYDGLTFHRVVGNFCLQGGDPSGDGTGHTDNPIKGEFSENGVNNPLADDFKTGTVAMARSRDADSASCQFFVTLSDVAANSLNGKYAAFGTVDEKGMQVVNAIVKDSLVKATGNSGLISKKDDQPVIKKIEIVD